MSRKWLYLASLLSANCMLTSAMFAQDSASKVAGADGFLSATKGLLAASDQSVQLGRSVERLQRIRTALTGALLENKATKPLDLGSIASLSNAALLCRVRANRVTLSADRAFLTAATGSIEKTATSSKIDTLSAAFGVLFKEYSIEVTADKDSKKKISDIIDHCSADLTNFGSDYYGLTGEPTADITDFISPIKGLWDAIVAIITPIATAAGQYIDDAKRAAAVKKYVSENKKTIEGALDRLSTAVFEFARSQRLRAAGSFAEQMAIIRATSVDPSKIKSCSDAFGAGSINAKVPSDQFMVCYSQIWKGIAEPVATALKAADQYDQFADASYAEPKKMKEDIDKQLSAIITPPEKKATLQDLWNTALKLLAFGQTVNSALSKSNRDAVQKAIDDLVKLF